ncbi:formyltransferase family protein [uncultured Chryseobacterium sp.]|uniref:formyltransferase family protein n=1 Tax=uncultured Chryseobacterium sp. TaxID=259322 RepID=UPI0025ECEE2C|nr:formyltransferase family protein [uncultured Chryseobacterium sp.]
MINKPKIAVLCNNRMAVPALQSLHAEGRLCAVGVAEGNTDVIDFCSWLSQSGVPFFIIGKENRSLQIRKMVDTTAADYIFTMTFPWKISTELLHDYPDTFYNFHYGLLPEMRGADPVFESIRSRAKETGITVHAIDEAIDRGAMILKKNIPLTADMTHGSLCTRLSWLGAGLLHELIVLLQSKVKGTLQDEQHAQYFPKPGIADVCISWQKQDAETIEALARACNPWNKGVYTQWNGWNIRIVEATVVHGMASHPGLPGTILSLDKEQGFIVKCNHDTHLRLDIVCTDEGFMSGHKLSAFGLKKGGQLINL